MTKHIQDVDETVCCRPKCKKESAVIYLGSPLCEKHWVQHCNKQDRDMEKSLNKKRDTLCKKNVGS